MDRITLTESDSDTSTAPQRFLPLVTAGLVIFFVVVWLACEIPRGALTHPDELLTAERTREILLTTPWTVHFNFKVSFHKPPLQYWLTTLTLPRLSNHSLAVRVWPLIFGALTLVATGWLAFLVSRDRPWLVPLSVITLAACPLFSFEASRALLDTGLAFFTTTAIICAQLARKKPIWWLGVAVSCWLGTLQKTPVTLLICLLILLIRFFSRTERPALRSGWLAASTLLALVAVAIWPLIQISGYGMPLSRIFNLNDLAQLFGIVDPGRRPYFAIPHHIGISTLGGFLALLAAIAFLLKQKSDFYPPVTEIAVICFSFVGVALLFNFRSPRYVLPIVPASCLILALGFHWLFERPRPIRALGIALLAILLSAGFSGAKIAIDRRIKDVAVEKRVAEEVGRLQQQGTRTVLIKARIVGTDLLYDSFYLFHGNLKFPTAKYTVDEIREKRPPAPILGVCVARDFPVVQAVYPDAQVQFSQAQFICWRVAAPALPP